ncbi:hypothetical protein D3C85_1363790 [compost metagenome]
MAVLVKQVAASSLEEGMAGDHVVRRYRVERNPRDAIAGGYACEPVGDAGHRAEARRSTERGVQLWLLVGGRADEYHRVSVELPCVQVGANVSAITQQASPWRSWCGGQSMASISL